MGDPSKDYLKPPLSSFVNILYVLKFINYQVKISIPNMARPKIINNTLIKLSFALCLSYLSSKV